MNFLKCIDEIFNKEAIMWSSINNLKSDEILSIIHFYEEIFSELSKNYPKSRKNSEQSIHKLKGNKYTFKGGVYTFKRSDYKFHHYLIPFHYILEDRFDFFKSVKIANKSWSQKKFKNALNDYFTIYNVFLKIKEKLSEIKGTVQKWYRKYSYRDIDYGSLPMQKTSTRTNPMYARGFSLDDIKNKKLIELMKNVKIILDDLNQFFEYKKYVKIFYECFETKSYNLAFDKYIQAKYHISKINPLNLEFFGASEEYEDIKLKYGAVLLSLTNKIKKTVIDLGTKFTRLEIKEIKEKCNVESTALIVEVVKKMIKDKMIYAEYFSSSNAILFNQQKNIEEIDNIMTKFEIWEKSICKNCGMEITVENQKICEHCGVELDRNNSNFF